MLVLACQFWKVDIWNGSNTQRTQHHDACLHTYILEAPSRWRRHVLGFLVPQSALNTVADTCASGLQAAQQL